MDFAPVKLIHRIWLDPGDDPIPELFQEWGAEWQALHPGWTVIDWTEPPDIPLPDLFWDAYEWCDDDWQRWQADILRLYLLFHYGGVYADCDIQPFRNIEPLLGPCVVGRSPQKRGGKHPVTNAFMVAEPNHPWIGKVIDQLPEAAGRSGDLAWRIGPWHLTRNLDESVTVLEDLYSWDFFTHHWASAKRRAGTPIA